MLVAMQPAWTGRWTAASVALGPAAEVAFDRVRYSYERFASGDEVFGAWIVESPIERVEAARASILEGLNAVAAIYRVLHG
jgi:hypothetical protein